VSQGNAKAMISLGLLLEAGRGVQKDEAKARALYQNAADLGEAGGLQLIGQMYELGHGVTQDYAAALEWYRKSAAAGNWLAAGRVSKAYQLGELGLAKDKILADQWYEEYIRVQQVGRQ
jgi:TPR repeat protein